LHNTAFRTIDGTQVNVQYFARKRAIAYAVCYRVPGKGKVGKHTKEHERVKG